MSSWLVDKSALVRLHLCPEAEEWSRRIERGLVAATTATRLELGFSVRNGADHARALSLPPLASMSVEYLTPAIEDRAVEVQGHLAARGLHRAPSVPDLLIAAAAELSGRTLLHLDKDFDLIAAITGQPVERLTTT